MIKLLLECIMVFTICWTAVSSHIAALESIEASAVLEYGAVRCKQ